jgi:hypothetical protein
MFLVPLALLAQAQRDVVPLKSWPAPLYFQPLPAESRERPKPEAKPDALNGVSIDASSSLAATPAGSLVFVAMTPCRIADTRDGTFPAGFGPPTLSGNATRTFAIQSTTSLCPVPSIAQAYSFNITVVPPGTTFPGMVNPSGALGHLTIWPTGVPQPVVSTLNSFLGTVVANAAIVPAGTSGSVNVFVSQSTDLIIDINGYYAPQSGITLAQGSSGAPSLSFSGDPGTGIFSSGAGTLNIATGGTNRLTVFPNGDLTSIGNVNISGNGFFGGNVGLGTTNPSYKLHLAGNTTSNWPIIKLENTDSGGHAYWLYGGANGIRTDFGIYDETDGAYRFYIQGGTGKVGIGTTNPVNGRLDVEVVGSSLPAVYGSGPGTGVYGQSGAGAAVRGDSPGGIGIYGLSSEGTAGHFEGTVFVSGCLTASNISCASDERLKENVTPLLYGLPEVLKLRPVTWQWKDATKTEPNLGLIAQDVEPVLPELVIQNADNKGALGLNYMGLVPVAINAIQQQDVQIKDQQKRIVEQQEQNRKLEERLAALEKLLSTIQPSTADR